MNLIHKLKDADKMRMLLLLCGTGTFSILLVFFRIYKTGSFHFIFLFKNLFLALIPWLLSTMFILYPKLKKQRILIILSSILWILFIPNSFYIITDLFHLYYENIAPVWYDLVLIFSFAWIGLLLGFSSLKDIELILSERMNTKIISLIISVLLFISSFGIYLGRILRWNSWNILTEPLGLLKDIKISLSHPLDHSSAWGMTILTGILLNLIWWSFKVFYSNKSNNKIISY